MTYIGKEEDLGDVLDLRQPRRNRIAGSGSGVADEAAELREASREAFAGLDDESVKT